MKSPPKMPQRAMVRIWVASLHQELQHCYDVGVSVLSGLYNALQGWMRTASTRRTVRRGKKPLRGFFRCAARVIHPRPPKNLNVSSTLRFLLYNKVNLTERVDSNSIDPPNSPAGKKAPVQQRRPLPAAETGRSCWGCGQQDARAAQGTMQPLGAATRTPFLRGLRNPPAPTKKPQRMQVR